MRVFFALWPDEAERDALAAWQRPLQKLCGGRAMQPDTLHATLVFLGEVAAQHIDALCLAAQEVQTAPFELRLESARYWGHNHIVYAAPSHTPTALGNLVTGLGHALCQQRFQFDQRAYQPHVTLLRDTSWRDAPLPAQPAVNWQIREFMLMQSISGSQGMRYKALAHFPLR